MKINLPLLSSFLSLVLLGINSSLAQESLSHTSSLSISNDKVVAFLGDLRISNHDGILSGFSYTVLINEVSAVEEYLVSPLFKVFPNPTTNQITIRSVEKIEDYQIFDSLGKLVVEGRVQQNIDVSNLTTGLYTLRLNNGEGVKFQKL